jgi:hypothetical protein
MSYNQDGTPFLVNPALLALDEALMSSRAIFSP